MVRAKRAVRRRRVKQTEEYDSDDPACYKNEEVPDKKSLTYLEDKVDEFHSKKISELLADGVQRDSDQEDEPDQEEVMPLSLQDSDDDDDDDDDEDDDEADMESDLEDRRGDDLPDDMAWGSKKKAFHDSDYNTTKGKSLEELEAEEKEEEEEAKHIQRRLAAHLSEEDYDLHLLQEFAMDPEAEESAKAPEQQQRIQKDLNSMSNKEKLKLLKKESPELLDLIQDFKTKLKELKDEIQPLVEMIKDGQIPPGKGADYLLTKQQLYLNYCTNISFYLVLKAKRVPAHNHPVIERLLTYRKLINELVDVDAKLAPQLQQLLSERDQERSAQPPAHITNNKVSDQVCVESDSDDDDDDDDEAALRFYRGVEERLKLKRKKKTDSKRLIKEDEEDVHDEAEMDEDAKRGITYQMAKNKGLTPKRKKIDRNPRVKHRQKYRRAQTRRKGQVVEARREQKRYSGELSGIRAGVKKSIKLK